MGGGDPYREAPTEPQFVCVVCWKTTAPLPGECPGCGVELLSLAEPEVRDEVRAEAERRLQQRQYAEWFWSYLVAAVLCTPVTWLVHGIIPAGVVWMAATMVVGGVNVKVWERLNPRSMLRLYADRRRRLALPPATGDAAGRHEEDLEDADVRRVVEILKKGR